MNYVPADVYGIDFLSSYPDPQLIWDRGTKFVAIYLKNWNKSWVARYMDLGGLVIPIMEVTADQAALGPKQGIKDALRGVQQAQDAEIPSDNSVPIIYTQDSSNWDAINHPGYFAAAEPIVRSHGYLFGGYGGKNSFNSCIAAGVTFDVIWQTNAYGWFGGRHPDRHATQGGHGDINWWNRIMYTGTKFDVSGMGNIDTNRSNKSFPAWGKAQTPAPVPLEDSMITLDIPLRVLGQTLLPAGTVHELPIYANEAEVVIHVVNPGLPGWLVAWGVNPMPPISNIDFPEGGAHTCTTRVKLDHGIMRIRSTVDCAIIVDLIGAG